MKYRLWAFAILATGVMGHGSFAEGRAQVAVDLPAVQGVPAPAVDDNVKWVETVMRRMETVKAGMTRADLARVFTTEGGSFSRSGQRFVSRDCPYFKVDVTFELADPPDVAAITTCRSTGGAPCTDEEKARFATSPQDRILSISRPYLQFTILD
jgi:hypothetical protein